VQRDKETKHDTTIELAAILHEVQISAAACLQYHSRALCCCACCCKSSLVAVSQQLSK
jgi:hypothetical protein